MERFATRRAVVEGVPQPPWRTIVVRLAGGGKIERQPVCLGESSTDALSDNRLGPWRHAPAKDAEVSSIAQTGQGVGGERTSPPREGALFGRHELDFDGPSLRVSTPKRLYRDMLSGLLRNAHAAGLNLRRTSASSASMSTPWEPQPVDLFVSVEPRNPRMALILS